MDRDLHIITPTAWFLGAWTAMIDAVGLFIFIKSPAIFPAIFTIIMTAVLVYILSFHKEVLFDPVGEGVAMAKTRSVLGIKQWTHRGLAKAETITAIKFDNTNNGYYQFYLLFTDGYKLPLPYIKRIIFSDSNALSSPHVYEEQIKEWFRQNYGIILNIKELKEKHEKKSFLHDVKENIIGRESRPERNRGTG